MVEVKHSGKSMEQRVADRLKNSGDVQHADHHAAHGTGPTRAHTNIHNTRNQCYGEDHPAKGTSSVARAKARFEERAMTDSEILDQVITNMESLQRNLYTC